MLGELIPKINVDNGPLIIVGYLFFIFLNEGQQPLNLILTPLEVTWRIFAKKIH